MPRKTKESTGVEVLKAIKTPAKASLPDARPKLKKRLSVTEPTKGKEHTDGKDYDSPKARPRSMAELWGYKGDKFGTDDEEEFKKKLSLMNKVDLQNECIKNDIYPNDNRQTMVDRLLKLFRQTVAARKTAHVTPQPIPKVSQASQKLRNWLASAGGNSLV